MNITKKIVATVVGLSMVVMMAPGIAQGVTIAELQAQIADLTAQLAALQAQAGAAACTFTRALYPGVSGADVKCLQQYLNGAGYAVAASGAGSAGNETEYYGPLTQAAVKKWQDANGIVYGAYGGYFGPLSQAKYAALTAAAAEEEEEEEEEAAAELEGGAGSVEEYDLASGIANEEVGEDEEDVTVAGLEINVDEGSDLAFTAVQLVFDEGTGATSDFEDYADEVSVWLDNNELARVDGDKFNDDNDWTKTVTLSGKNIIKAGKTGTLYVKISGVSNLDTNDAGDEWDVDFTSIRFRDAQGSVISEDPTVATTTFSFETYATAANLEFKISAGADADTVNDEHVIDVDATDDTDNVDILSFNVEIKGDSDVYLDALPVTFDVTGASNVDEMITGLTLLMDGDKVGTASVASDCLTDADCVDVGTTEDYLFDNLDLTLKTGKDYEFMVQIDLASVADDLDEGDTIGCAFGETETDLAEFDAEDETGEDLADGDKTGTVTGENSAVYDNGLQVKFTGSSYVKTTSDTTNINETVEFTLTFEATAFGDDIWVDQTCAVGTTGTDVDAIEVSLDGDADGSSTTCTDFDSTGDEGTDGYEVEEGQTETFTVTILGDGGEAGAAGSPATFKARINGIGYNVTTDAAGDTCYAFSMEDYKSSAVSVYDR